jgi:ribonuclease D
MWVDTQAGLREALAHIAAGGLFAYDTEFIGERSYFPRLCLIQLASTTRLVLVDPLAPLDLQPLWKLIADPAIETIVHAGAQDLEPVVRLSGRPAAAIFDTQIAAGFADLPYPLSLQKLVLQVLGVRLVKAHTFTRWDLRPLSVRHLRYAADDVRYLPALAQELRTRLRALGHERFATEECAAMADPANFSFDPDVQLNRVNRSESLRSTAREEDLPPRTLVRDDVLIRLAKGDVDDLETLRRVNGLPVPLIRSRGRDILEAMSSGRQRSAAVAPDHLPLEESIEDRLNIDRLWSAAECYCLGRAIDPALVSSRQELSRFYLMRKNRRAVRETRVTSGWRAELLGEFLAAALDGGLKMKVTWDGRGFRSEMSRTELHGPRRE